MSFLIFVSKNIDYILAFALIVAFLVFLIWLYIKLREAIIGKLQYSRSFSEVGVYEGEHVTMTETLYNPTFLPIFAVNIEGYYYNGIRLKACVFDPRKAMQYYVSKFTIMPFQQIKRSHDVLCDKRGYYMLETVSIFYNKKTRYIDAPAEVYIFPRIIPLSERADPVNIYQGDSVSRRCLIKDPFSFSGIRQYTYGDPFSSINFKATARSGAADISTFRVNSRDFCSNRTFMVYLNFQTGIDDMVPTVTYDRMMELGMSYASDLIRQAAYNGHRAGFASNPITIDGADFLRFPIQSGESHLVEILKQLAKVRNRPGVSFRSLLEQDIKKGLCETEIYIITPYANAETEELVFNLRSFENTVCIVNLPDQIANIREEEDLNIKKQQIKGEADERHAYKNERAEGTEV